MIRFEDFVVDQLGNALSGKTVTVRVANATPGSGALATIYSDDGTTLVSGSALTTDAQGRFFFYAPDGRYDLTISGTNITTYIRGAIELTEQSSTTLDCASFAGADAGAKMIACLSATATGGVADARGLVSTQSGTSTVAIPANKTLLLGGMHYTSTANPPFTLGIGSKLLGIQKDTARITWSANNAAIVLDSVSAAEVGNLLLSPSGTGSSVRGVELRNTTADNKWNYVHDIRMAASSVQTGQYGVYLNASAVHAMYWNTVERIQGVAIDWTVVLEGDVTGANVANGNFIRDILGAANTGCVWLTGAGDNHIFGVFHSLSGGPASTTGVKFGDGTVAGAASNNHVYGLISDAGSSAVAYDITANSKGNTVFATVQGGTPTRGTAGDGNMAFEATFAAGVIIYWDGVKLYRSATDQLSLDDHLNITALAPAQAAFRRTGALATDFAFVAAVTGDSVNRYQMDAGAHDKRSSGSGAADVGIVRDSAGVMRLSNASSGYGKWDANVFESKVATGTAPFVVASTTNVANLNASSLNGATFAAPGEIGGGTPATGTFTALAGNRFKATGTALVAGDFALHANWGTGAAIGTITGTDQGWQGTVTAATTPGASPTLILTFKDGTWTNAPICISKMIGGTGTTTELGDSVSATAHTITFNGTPVDGQTYIIAAVCIGR